MKRSYLEQLRIEALFNEGLQEKRLNIDQLKSYKVKGKVRKEIDTRKMIDSFINWLFG
jgi:hypothetical protein